MLYHAFSGSENAPRACGGAGTDIRVRNEGTFVVFEIDGPLALSWASDELCRVVRHLAGGGRKNLVLDLAGAPFVDSAGVGALAATLNLVQSLGGKLVLLSVQPRVLSVLTRLRLDKFFTFSEDRTFAFTKS